MNNLPSHIFIITQIFINLLCLVAVKVNDLKLGQTC